MSEKQLDEFVPAKRERKPGAQDEGLTMIDHSKARRRMVDVQLTRRGVRDPAVLAAMRAVPRERFVPQRMAEFAYEDGPLPIEAGQTISQPYIVAAMIEAAELGEDDRVLEVGAGSGYAAAVLSQVAGEVIAIERQTALARLARERMMALGYGNVAIREGDGTLGLPDEAPFDAILVAAGGPRLPDALKGQLAIGGRLVMPVGEEDCQTLCKITRVDEDRYEEESLGAVAFVPLIGEHGWQEDGSRSASNHKAGASRKQALPDMIADAAEPLPDFDDPAFGQLFERFADRKVVLLRGGEPRNQRVLSSARRHHPPPDRASRLHDRCRGGGLARRRDRRPLCPTSRATRRRRETV